MLYLAQTGSMQGKHLLSNQKGNSTPQNINLWLHNPTSGDPVQNTCFVALVALVFFMTKIKFSVIPNMFMKTQVLQPQITCSMHPLSLLCL